jgi:hypothetical protein
MWVKIRGAMAGAGEFRRFGPYVLLRTSGAGGMGRIELALRAQSGGIPALCVLKRMHAELRSREQDARFRREASIALQLSHPAIAGTVGVEKIDGELVLLQELVHGVDLRLLGTRLVTACERVPLPVAVQIVSEVARALAYAHAFRDLGIVHRDVTPDNVMLSFSGEVKLIDFGIARSDVDATLTSAGQIVGRPTYTAPEIWAGGQADRRADIYSLGVVLWQLLTGRPLEDVHTDKATAAPAPSAHNPQVPPALDAVIARALALEPDQRYQHAGELQQALQDFFPPDFRAERALRELLARHFDVTRERRMLAADVQRAMQLLRGPAAKARTEKRRGRRAPAGTTVLRPSQGQVAFAIVVAAGLALAAGLGVRSLRARRRPNVAKAPLPMVAVTRSVPAPPPIPDEPPAPTVAKTPVRARPLALTAGRTRPPVPMQARTAPPTPSVPTEELLRRAQDKYDVGETQVALTLARQAANAGARAPAHVLMGKVMMSERRFDEAEREFAEAVRLDPGDARAARMLALVRETRGNTP